MVTHSTIAMLPYRSAVSDFTCWVVRIRLNCAILCGQLVVVGGIGENHKETTAISAYDEATDSWKAMEAMKISRARALVATLPDSTIIVLGGHSGGRLLRKYCQ